MPEIFRLEQSPIRVSRDVWGCGYLVPLSEINEVGQHIARGHGQVSFGDVGINTSGQRICRGRALRQMIENLSFPLQTVPDEPVEPGPRILDRGAVAGQEQPIPPHREALAGCKKIPHVAVRWRNDGCRPAHHEVSGEHDLSQRKRNMPAEMARRVKGLQPSITEIQRVAVCEQPVRKKVGIDAFSAAQPCFTGEPDHAGTAPGLRRTECQDRGRDICRQLSCASRVVPMRMGHHDCAHPCAADRSPQRVAVAGVVRSGVDNDHLAGAHDIRIRSPKCHRPGIGSQHPPDAVGNLDGDPGSRYFCFACHGPDNSVRSMEVHWLNRYLPRSLYGRAAVILLVPVVTVQLVVSVGFIQRHYDGVTRQMTENVLLEVSTLVARVEAAPDPFEAADAAEAYARPVEIETTLPAASPVEDARRFYDLSGRSVTGTLRAGLAGLVAVDLESDADRVSLLVETSNGPLGLSFSRERVSASNPHQLLILMVATSALMTIVAYVFLWNQLKPVRRMAEAAEAFGRGQAVRFRPEGATELRRAGAAFLEMRGRIERHIDQRTKMLSGVSHDIRTPLTRMRLGLSLLPEGPERDALERDVTDMEGMLEAFLDFARGEGAGQTEPVDPEELLERVVEKARRAGQAVEIGDRPADGAGMAELRPLAIERALDNLVSNAVRYGSRAIVSLASTARVLRFTVEDDGPGIPSEARDEALRPFVRLDEARNQDSGTGVGLGLSIAADIARQHGGTLRLGDSARLGGLAVDLVIARKAS